MPGVAGLATSDSLALGVNSRDRGPSVSIHDPITLVAPSFALSSHRVSVGVGPRAVGRTDAGDWLSSC